MDIQETIKPFKLIYEDSYTSVILRVGSYRSDIFLERGNEGFEGGGYDWASLATVFLNEKLPGLKSDIGLDPEASMFCAYSKDKKALETFALAFHAMCENSDQMRDFFSRAELLD